ncbi:hypothetical protein AC578_4872 [Pseudocercospora eumusae]|uniref:Uncharacterized protein n=1 Tax=Pseudocercospora eumusae TaxID=321146 RepID=A0A139HC61_9PEZI|nr:hypothetical protein AC578_4872 [Pseudocercospora eumusae]
MVIKSIELMHEPRSDSSSGSVRSKGSSAGRLRQIFSSVDPITVDDREDVGADEAPDEQKRPMWSGRVNSYNRLMHAHTMYQMEGKTLPGYKKTLHAYTQNQLYLHRTASRSETSRPLTIDDAPIAPANSPSPEQQHAHRPPSTRGLKPRSATEPVPRAFQFGPARSINTSTTEKQDAAKQGSDQDCHQRHTTRPLSVFSPCWKPKPPSPKSPDLLHTLPPEIRNLIYALLMPDTSLIFWPPVVFDRECVQPPILLTAKYIRKEVSPMYYGRIEWVFRIDNTPGSFKSRAEKWRDIVALCGPKPFKSFQIWFDDPAFQLEDVIEEVYALVELIHDTGFEPDLDYAPGDGVRPEVKARSIASGTRLFHTGRKRGAGPILGRAVALGRRARSENWSKKKLAERFSTFVKVARSKNKKWPDGL